MVKVSTRRSVGAKRSAPKPQRGDELPSDGSSAPAERRESFISIPEDSARCQGGPRHGWVYFVRDLRTMARLGEWSHRPFPYKATRTKTVLPGTGGVEGVVWRYYAVEVLDHDCECGNGLYTPNSQATGQCEDCRTRAAA